MSFDMNTALQVCTATLQKRAKARSNSYILYYANEVDQKKGRYTGKIHGVTIPQCMGQLSALDREYPYVFIWSIKEDRMIRFSTPANMAYNNEGKRKLAMVAKAA